ncbi:uncharacterized protein LOC128238106 [Mya arenaria]|uniref:uncharacterized protein LOC128238106 n=1 Tax=Mya arenaria TaxID=6604 RepID=UPI0022DEB3D1|nr:uncharacterized protein LOC128238106 [Mya arenaria]
MKDGSCLYCPTIARVMSFDQVKQGHHIVLSGNRLYKNKSDRRKSAYKHHAIVENSEPIGPNDAILTLIHYYGSDFSSKLKLRRSREMVNLRNDDIHIVHHSYTMTDTSKLDDLTNNDSSVGVSLTKTDSSKHENPAKKDNPEDDSLTKKDGSEDDSLTKTGNSKHENSTKKDSSEDDSLAKKGNSEDDRLKRAYETACQFLERKSEEEKKKYHLLFNNCEHFCNYCHVSTETSMQVNEIINTICVFGSGFGHFCAHSWKIIHHVSTFLSKHRPLLQELFKRSNLTSTVIGLVPIVLNVVVASIVTIRYIIKWKNGALCISCLRQKIIAIWLSVIMSFLVAGGVFLLFLYVACPHGWPALGTSLVLVATATAATGIMYYLVKTYKKHVPNKVPRMCKKLTTYELLKKGDVISFKSSFFRRRSYMLIAEKPTNSDVKCIFYQGIYKQTLNEEAVKLDFSKQDVRLHMYDGIVTYGRNEVVERARCLQQESVKVFKSQSGDFCDWAKRKLPSLNCSTDQKNIKYKGKVNLYSFKQENVAKVDETRNAVASIFLPPTRVRISDDIHTGRSIINLDGEDCLVVSKTEGSLLTELEIKCFSFSKEDIITHKINLKNRLLFSKMVHPALSDLPENIRIKATEISSNHSPRFKSLSDLIRDKNRRIYEKCPKGTLIESKTDTYYVSSEIIEKDGADVQMYELSKTQNGIGCELKKVRVDMANMKIHGHRDSAHVHPPEAVLKRVERLNNHLINSWNHDLKATISWLCDLQIPSHFKVNATEYTIVPYFRTTKKFQPDISPALLSQKTPKRAEELKVGMIICFKNHLCKHFGILVHSKFAKNNSVQITVLYKSNKPFRDLQERTMCRKLLNVGYIDCLPISEERINSVREYKMDTESNGDFKLSETELCCKFALGHSAFDLVSWNVHSVLDIPCKSILCSKEKRRVGLVEELHTDETLRAQCFCGRVFELDLKTLKTVIISIVDPEQIGSPGDRHYWTKMKWILEAMHTKQVGKKFRNDDQYVEGSAESYIGKT